MNTSDQEPNPQHPADDAGVNRTRRATLRRLGRFAAISAPAVTLLLSAATKPASAVGSGGNLSSRQLKEPVSVPQLQRLA